MRHVVLALLLGAGLSLSSPPVRGQAGEGQEVKILAKGQWPHLPVYGAQATPREKRTWRLRSAKELQQVAGPHSPGTVARALGVKAIDFDRQMLLAVYDGTQPLVGVSGGGPPSAPYRVAITGVATDAEGKALTVRWRRVRRLAKEPVVTSPLEAVLVKRFDGAVRFEEFPADDGGAADKGAGAGKGVKILARAFWPEGWRAEMPPQQWVVRSYRELIDPRLAAPEPVLERMRKENAARYARALKVAEVDFTKQMILGVSAGAQPAGSRVEVIRVERDKAGKTLTVHWRLLAVAPQVGKDGLTHPAAVVLVDQSPAEVRFRQQPAGQ
jgi:hypothetical protein